MPILQEYINLSCQLPVELRQQVLVFSLKQIDEDYRWYKQTSNCHLKWTMFIDIIRYVSPKISMIVCISSHDAKVTLILKNKVRIIFINSPFAVGYSWLNLINDFCLVRLEVSTTKISPPITTTERKNRETFVYLINFIISSFRNQNINNYSLDIAYTEYSPGLSSHLLSSSYSWLGRITSYRSYASIVDIDNLCSQRDRFKSLRTVTFMILPSFILEFRNYYNKLEELLHFLDKLNLSLRFYDEHLADDFFFEFVNKHQDKIMLKLGCISGPFNYQEDLMLKRADKIGHFLVSSSFNEQLPESIRTSAQNSNLYLPANTMPIKTMSISVERLRNIKLESYHLQELKINATSCVDFNLSNLIKLHKLSLVLDECLDMKSFDSIPPTVTTLLVKLNFDIDCQQFTIPRFVQSFSCNFLQLQCFDFSNNEHLTKLDLEVQGVGSIHENNPAWRLIPQTVKYITIQHIIDKLNVSILDYNDKLFGVCIPETITNIYLFLRTTRLSCDEILINFKGDTLYSFMDNYLGKRKNWINLHISERTKLELLLPNDLKDVLIKCGNEVSTNIECRLEGSDDPLKKIHVVSEVSNFGFFLSPYLYLSSKHLRFLLLMCFTMIIYFMTDFLNIF